MKDFKDMQFKITRDTDRGLHHYACGRQNMQLNTYDWLYDVPGNDEDTDLVEVQFKNTRKGYYHNVNNLDLHKGDIVAVEASPGHDIGTVTLTGRLVKLQLKKANLKSADDIKRVYRIAKPVDIDKYNEAKSREHGTMIQSRQIAKDLGLQMKIGDVEYQGDGNKAIFYYIADERVDFRQLIKVLADTFHVRIEMKQIGARQEAGRIGGTGPCGRELCCATWMKNFVSVSTNAARIQDISLNPQKLAGMCAKLKCCLNYEVDDYVEASRKMPARDIVLQTLDSDYYLFKSDILAGTVVYSTDKGIAANLEEITAERARAIIEMNKRGEKPESLTEDGTVKQDTRPRDLLADADISRFDKARKRKKKPAKRQGGAPVSTAPRKGEGQRRNNQQRRNNRPEGEPTQGVHLSQVHQPKGNNNSVGAAETAAQGVHLSQVHQPNNSTNNSVGAAETAAPPKVYQPKNSTDSSVGAAETAAPPKVHQPSKKCTNQRIAPTALSVQLRQLHPLRMLIRIVAMKRAMSLRIAAMTLALVAMLLTACDHRTIYDRYESTALSGWEKNDTITFAIRPLKDAATYRALLGVRTTDSYPFTSLTLIVEQEIMPAHRVLVDTICCELTDEQGKVLGDGIGYRQYQFEVRQLQLQEGDSLHVVVRHDMKREILPGICDVGIKLLKE